MNQSSIQQRHLAILRLVQPPFQYPSKEKIIDFLREQGLESVSKRTFERDKKELEDYYGVRVAHCPRRRGYYLDQPEDEDLSSFRQFFQLLERSERLAFLTNSTDALRASRYLLLEESPSQLGLQHLPVLWDAFRAQRQLAFGYQTFRATLPKPYQVDPLLLLEYRSRWYLAAWDASGRRFKTFGLERIRDPRLSESPVTGDRRAEFIALRRDGLGVSIGPDRRVTKVRLRVDAAMAPYLKTVPLHPSQAIEEENDQGIVLSLRIILNPELEMTLLSYGEHLEVLDPLALRARIRQRAQAMLKQYEH